MTDMKKMMPLILLAVIFTVGLPFVVSIMGTADSGVDLSGTDYEDQYNSTTSVSKSSIVILQVIPYILVTVLLISVVGVLKIKGRF